jgi:PAS domain S-box-containing protein
MNTYENTVTPELQKKNKTILLVEDEVIIAMMETQQLKKEGYDLIHAINGEEAISIISKENIDLILMDIDLGVGIDGTQTAKEILKTNDVPVVFLSSRSEKEMVQKTEKITSYGYIMKNSGINVINASIKMAFKLYEANKKLERQNEQLRTILHSIGDAVIATDRSGKIIRMNPIAENLTGWNSNEAEGTLLNEVFNIVNAQTRELAVNPVNSVLSSGQIVGLANHTLLISKNGFEYQISDSGSPIKDADGNVTGVVLVFRDVTKEYEIQRRIEESENRFRTLIEDLHVGILLQGPKTEMLLSNKAALNMLGVTEDQLLGKTSIDPDWNVIHEDGSPFPGDTHPVPKAIATKKPVRGVVMGVYRPITKDRVWLWVNAEPELDDQGNVEKVICTFSDITDRKIATDALKKESAFSETLIESLPGIFYHLDLEGKLIGWNNNLLALVGNAGIESAKNSVLNIIHDKDRALVSDAIRLAFEKGYAEVEARLKVENGSNKEFFFNGKTLVKDNQFYLLGTGTEITERKKVEKEVRDMNTRLSRAQRIAHIGSWETYIPTGDLHWSEEMYHILGFPLNTPVNLGAVTQVFPPEELEKFKQSVAMAIDEGENYKQEYRIIRPDGEIRYIHDEGEVVRDENGKVIWMYGTTRDITEYKKIENALRETEESYRLLFETSLDAILLTATDGEILNINPAGCKIFERTLDEIITGGRSGIVDKSDPRLVLALEERERTGKFIGELTFIRKSGVTFPGEVSTAVFKNNNGYNMTSMIIRDVTERKLTEEKIHNLLAEKELILKEVHHRIKNNMNTIFSLLTLQEDAVQKNPAIKSILNDAAGRVQSMMVLYDKLYRSENTTTVSIKEYFPALINEIVNLFPQKSYVKVNTQIEDILLDTKTLSTLGILMNELITNAMKYAFIGRSEGIISVTAYKKENRVFIIFADNGVGMPQMISTENSKGFGLQLIEMLLRQIRGKSSIEYKNGTTFILEFER